MTLDRTPAVGASARTCSSRPEEALRVAEAAHPAQHGRAGVLEGEVEVGHDAGGGGDRLDQAGAGLRGLQVGDTHAVDAVEAGDLGQQRLEQPQVAEVLAVGGGVLGDQEELAGALAGQPAGLGQHVGGTAAHERAAEGRDRAERAAAVAAAGQLERRHRPGVETAALGRRPGGRGGRGPVDRADREQPAPVLRGVRVRALAGDDRAQAGGDVGVVVEAQHGVGLGQRLREVLAVALGHAADRDHGLDLATLLSPDLEVGGGQESVDGVLLGGLDEAAGVDHHGVGLSGVLDQAEAVGGEPPGELLGVDVVAGAAQGQQGDREWGSHGCCRVCRSGGPRSERATPPGRSERV